jgi:hypothetical protein
MPGHKRQQASMKKARPKTGLRVAGRCLVTLWAWLGRLAVKACHGGYCAAFRTLSQGGARLPGRQAAKADDCQIWQQEEDGGDHCCSVQWGEAVGTAQTARQGQSEGIGIPA